MIPHAKELAVALVQLDFGDIVADVCRHLFLNASSLKHLERTTSHSLKQLQTALLVLLQHHCIQPYQHIKGAYVASEADILNRLYVPRLCTWARDRYGELAEAILTQLHFHGHLRLSRVITALPSETEPAEVVTVFRQLLDDNLVCRTGVSESSAARYTLPKECAALSKSQAGQVADTAKDERIYWRVNMSAFIRMYKQEWLVGWVQTELGEEASSVFSSLLSLAENKPGKAVDPHLAHARVTETSSHELSEEDVAEYLEILSSESQDMVRKLSNGSYQLDLHVCEQVMTSSIVERAISERYGEKHLRLYRVLKEKKVLEQEQLCSLAMVGNFKGTRVFLNELFRDKLIQCQEVPKTADRAPSRCVYLWSADERRAADQVMARCYQTEVNMLARIRHEEKTNSRILNKADALRQQEEEADSEAELERVQARLTKLRKIHLAVADDLLLLDRSVQLQ